MSVMQRSLIIDLHEVLRRKASDAERAEAVVERVRGVLRVGSVFWLHACV